MKKYILIFLLSVTEYAYSQSVNKLETTAKKDSIYFDEERLQQYIQYATDNTPNSKVAYLKTLVAKKDVELARWSWTESIVAQFNLNESNINAGPLFGGSGAGTNNFYPRYLFALRLNLGTFVLTPLETKKAKEQYKISLVEQDNQKNTIITEVTRRYQTYILKQKSLVLRLNAEVKITTLYNALKNSTQNKDYNYLEKEAQIFSTYTQALEAKNMAEAEVRIAKTELEQLLGTKLENIK